jgi:hypothetical protein
MSDRTKRQTGGELEQLLGGYARARLSPNPARMARIRSRLLTEARHTLAEPVPASPALTLVGATAPRRGSVSGWRRTAVALLAASIACLTLAGGVLAASQAGGPLYQARLWVETATLPTEPTARADAEMARLQTRLDEARDAASRGDGSAVSAALAAYQATVDEALAAAGENHDVLARLEIELTRHQVVLEALEAILPANAADAIRQVLDRESHALDVIHQRGPGANPGNGSGGGGAGGGGAGGQPTDHPGGQPTDHPGGQPTDHPGGQPTAKPDAPPDQGGATQRPDKSPRAPAGH